MTPHELAKAYALQKTGLRWDRLDTWTSAQRSAYLAALSEFRQANAALFTPAEMQAAANYASAAAARDPQFSYVTAFGAALVERVEEIGGQVAGVGEGVFSGLSLMRWLIPLGVVAVAYVLIRDFARSGASATWTRHFHRTRRARTRA